MATELKTEHPHIVRVPGVLDGEPIIAGTRVGVAFVARLVQAGEEVSEIVAAYPRIEPAAIYDAVSYYLDHRDEIDPLIADASMLDVASRYGFTIEDDGRVVFAER